MGTAATTTTRALCRARTATSNTTTNAARTVKYVAGRAVGFCSNHTVNTPA
jgi:hypothetical protein